MRFAFKQLLVGTPNTSGRMTAGGTPESSATSMTWTGGTRAQPHTVEWCNRSAFATFTGPPAARIISLTSITALWGIPTPSVKAYVGKTRPGHTDAGADSPV